MKVAFVGLGVMGGPMAGHLAAAGHEVRVFNRTRAKAEHWAGRHRGTIGATPADAARDAEAALLCVGNDDDVREVVLGTGGVLGALGAGAVIVDHTTTSARLAREMASVAGERGVAYLDAPVSGGQAGAENGVLTVMAGGDAEALERVRPLVECYARSVALLGPSGAGQLTKMVNQICIAGLVEGLAEGLHFARVVGLDPQAVVDVIAKGAAQSWQMDHRHATMLAGHYEHGFAVDWMRKDLGFVLDEARRQDAHLPVTALVDQLYGEVQALGGGRWDTSSLLARLEALRTRRGA
jgi:3-hydroxyisobutyrate dehydrogenase-like beta-hydroxyacid dehydrogenase